MAARLGCACLLSLRHSAARLSVDVIEHLGLDGPRADLASRGLGLPLLAARIGYLFRKAVARCTTSAEGHAHFMQGAFAFCHRCLVQLGPWEPKVPTAVCGSHITGVRDVGVSEFARLRRAGGNRTGREARPCCVGRLLLCHICAACIEGETEMSVPASVPQLPLPLEEDFEAYAEGQAAKWWSVAWPEPRTMHVCVRVCSSACP